MELVRASKLLSERGVCSRREADRYIEEGLVKVDGKIISLGEKVPQGAEIELLEEAKIEQKRRVTIILNKPLGYVSNLAEERYTSAKDLITQANQFLVKGQKRMRPPLRKLGPAGRLDINSSGLLVFTQDGTVAKHIIGEGTKIEKEYIVRVKGRVTEDKLKLLSHGLSLDGKVLLPAQVKQMKPNLLHFILVEGKKRQIRRMCELVDLYVLSINRVRIGKVRLGSLPEGKWRYLLPHEEF